MPIRLETTEPSVAPQEDEEKQQH